MPEPDDTELWRHVVGWEGWYSVSNLGRLRRDKRGPHTNPGKLLVAKQERNGYHHISLSRNGRRWCGAVHRIVAAAFIGPCPPGLQVNHKNGIKSDNRAENLEYVTPSQNTGHAYDALGHERTCGQRIASSKLTDEEVAIIRRLYGSGCVQRRLAAMFHVSPANICLIVHGKLWDHVPRQA